MKKNNKKIIRKLMKYFLLVLFLSLMCDNSIEAAEDKYFPPALGPTFAWKAGTNGITTPYGRKNGLMINSIPDAGISFYAPLSLEWNIGMNIDLMYNTHSFMMKYDYDGRKQEYKNKDEFRFSYVSLSSSFHYAGFNFGFSYGVPVNANWAGTNISTNKINNLWEVKVGWSYPIYYDATGKLNFYINANYALNGVYLNFAKDDPLKNLMPAIYPQVITNYYNPRPVGIQMGFNFLFSLITLPEEYYEK